jgi:colanic acid/amylovoran biosynthesis protein
MNILILNVHSALNLGDDGIMYETLKALRSEFPEATITVAANDPKSWQSYKNIHLLGSLTSWVVDHNNSAGHWQKTMLLPYLVLLLFVSIIYRFFQYQITFGNAKHQSLLKAYYDADLVLSCGGGNFYAHRPIRLGFIWSLLTLAFAYWLGKEIILLPQSIGPIEGKLQKLLARLLFNHVNLILLRERRSQTFLKKKLNISKPTFVLPDLAFGLSSAFDTPSPFPEEGSLSVGVTVIDRGAQKSGFSHQQIYEDALASLLAKLNKDLNAHIYFFVQCYGPTRDQDDRHSTRRVYERVRKQTDQVSLLDSFQSAKEIKEAYKRMDCVIGSRMHTGVFALGNGVPTVLIAYQPKALGLMEMFDLDRYCCNIRTVTEDELFELVYEVLDSKEEISAHIAENLKLVQQALQGWERYLRR